MSESALTVAGIDAVMIYADDPAGLSAWYAAHLGIETRRHDEDGNYYGDVVDDEAGKTTHIGIYPASGEAARLARGAVMVNYRVEDVDAAVAKLEAAGVEIDSIVDESFGRFAYLADPEGNPIELWSPSGRG